MDLARLKTKDGTEWTLNYSDWSSEWALNSDFRLTIHEYNPNIEGGYKMDWDLREMAQTNDEKFDIFVKLLQTLVNNAISYSKLRDTFHKCKE